MKLKVISRVLQAKDMCVCRYVHTYMVFIYLYMHAYFSVHTYAHAYILLLVNIQNIIICLNILHAIHETAYTGSMQKVTIQS